MARRIPENFILAHLENKADKEYVYPEIPFEYNDERKNVTIDQWRIINRLLDNFKKPAGKKILHWAIRAPRRTGKTVLFTRLCSLTDDRHKIWDFNPKTCKFDKPGEVHIMIAAMTKGKAKDLYLKPLMDFSREIGLGYRFNSQLDRIETPRGNCIWFCSLRDKRSAELIRGHKFSILLVDETQGANDEILKKFVRADAGPAMTDYGGIICLTGTEPEVPFGFWHEVSGDEKGYEVEIMKIENNIFYPLANREAMIEEERLIWGWEKGNEPAWVKREYRGERVWDGCNTVFQYEAAKNHYTEVKIPQKDRMYVIGVDLGFHDADAFAVMCYSLHSNEVYLVEEYVRQRQDITTCCEKVHELSEKYDNPPVIVDSGSIGRKVMEEMITRYSISAEAAEKRDKGGWIQSMRTALRRGDLKIRATSEAVEEMAKTEWDEKHEGWRKDGFHPNLLDAMVYAFRDIYNMCSVPEEEPPAEPVTEIQQIQRQIESRLRYQSDQESGYHSLLD